MSLPAMRPICLSCALSASALPAAHAQQDTAAPHLPRVEVVLTAPIGAALPRDRVPGNVQQLDAERLRELSPLNLPDLLGAHLGSVTVNETQGNPYQVEVNYRGFTASPLLGVPQGLSVYVDGVRVNEPFGDVVNWDLIARGAIADVTLMPGSNPLFGLNTLGGALAVRMKRGDTDPGTEAELAFGSFGRRSVEASHGRRLGDGAHLFVAGAAFREDGWRDFSPSRLGQLFVRGGRRVDGVGWDLSLAHANTDLIGNGLLPQTFLDARPESVYTRPDRARNEMTMLTLNGELRVASAHQLAGTAYLRRLRTNALTGDLSDDYDPPAVAESGVENRTHARQRGAGLALQWNGVEAGLQWMAGVSHDRASTAFEQTAAEGLLDGTRAVVPDEDPQVQAAIAGHVRTSSVFASATWSATPQWHLSASGRYNRTRVTTVDVGRIGLGLPTTLDGDARYTRFNPALGVVWQATPALTGYANLSEGNRAPSPIELGCSDPANPCVLPNALQSDPPLAQVLSRTAEFGVRGTIDEALRWNASVFRTVNRDDILFVSNTLAAGYFRNFGRTQRQGVEIGVSGTHGGIDLSANYALLDATYRSGACIVAEANSSAETSAACPGEGEIEIRPGDRMPNLPRHTFKLDAGWRASDGWRFGANVVAQSSMAVRGNENGAHRGDGVEFLGSGRVRGFALLHLDARWQFAAGWSLAAKLTNVFDRRHASGGALAGNAFDASGVLLAPADWRNELFAAPGAPRALWLTLRYATDSTP